MGKIAFVSAINKGVVEPIYASWEAPTGTTNTISGSPTYTLYDADGVAVTGHDAQAVTGFNNTALAAPNLWKTLDTSSIAVGQYRIVFTFTVTNSGDSIARTEKVEGIIRIVAIP